jgi:hypothetical protein
MDLEDSRKNPYCGGLRPVVLQGSTEKPFGDLKGKEQRDSTAYMSI